jgi:hypothetical protein
MSDTEAMTRLMDNAAHSCQLATAKLRGLHTHSAAEQDVYTEAIAAMAYARGVLQMVSASVSPEGNTIRAELISRLGEGYDEWAEREGAMTMSDHELATIGRYLRAVTLSGGESS